MSVKFSKLTRNSAKAVKSTNLNKKNFVKKFLKNPSGIIWPKEMKVVKTLFQIFPDENFWNNLELNFKLNSLCWFLSDDGRKLLNTEYKKFNLNLPEVQKFEVDNNNIAFESKSSYYSDKSLNLREFLNLWQKKQL
jgi:hypothetical protein